MRDKCGIAFFMFGTKTDKGTGETVVASGMLEEFEIAHRQGKYVFPIGVTGGAAKILADKVLDDYKAYNDTPLEHGGERLRYARQTHIGKQKRIHAVYRSVCRHDGQRGRFEVFRNTFSHGDVSHREQLPHFLWTQFGIWRQCRRFGSGRLFGFATGNRRPQIFFCKLSPFKKTVCLQAIPLDMQALNQLLTVGNEEFSYTYAYPENDGEPHWLFKL